jgi:uncharacterized protein (DUF2235 family)
MALYAFDGTWNKDKPGSEEDTNVVWFRDAYQGEVHYFEGVGTRFGEAGKILGGITGAGGRDRVHDGLRTYRQNLKNGDQVIDIVGFSRGGALALHFANQINIESRKRGTTPPPIRFLGLWDAVPSFGIAAIPINIRWDLGLADNVEKCFHALALDECRLNFHLHRPDARVSDANQEGRLFEVWFRGVHSDVGGGNRNPGLASIALNWMFAKGRQVGLPLKPAVMAQNAERINQQAIISVHGFDPIKNRFRVVRWNDQAHVTVGFRPDTKQRLHNNPPNGLALVDDLGAQVGSFQPA